MINYANKEMKELDVTEKTITIENLYRDHRRQLKFDLAIQRGKVWNHKQKSLFIHTILVNYRFPEVYAQNKCGSWFVLDGKQRLNTVFEYLDNGFPLHTSTPDVYGVSVADLTFEQLSEKNRRKILSTVFRVVFFENMTIEQRDDMFYRLNNGTPLNAFEKSRSKYSQMIKDAKKLARMPFMEQMVYIPARSRAALADQQLVYILSLLYEKGKNNNGVNNRAIEMYIDELKEADRSIDVESLKGIFLYLEEASKDFTDKQKKKILVPKNVIAIFMLAKRCVENKTESTTFKKFILSFFENLSTDDEFELTKGKGSVSKDKVNLRITILEENFEEWLTNEVIQKNNSLNIVNI